ncbi:serine protease [Pseudonocardia nematodicida]|uniref:Serine protease n=1 Tax=Pseudonocardia nematodicida TaxID=1206997 RepID=A0ABV1KBZ8_9PSEU
MAPGAADGPAGPPGPDEPDRPAGAGRDLPAAALRRPRRTASLLAAGLAASAVLALLASPADPAGRPPAPQPAPASSAAVGPTTSARAVPGPLPVVPAGPAAIGPGTVTETAGAGLCTAGFVLTAGPRTFLAQAAHCAGTGDETATDGCVSPTVPLGTPVTVRGAGRTVTGTLAWSSWVTMQARGETDPDTCAFNDFALVELPPEAADAVGAAVPFFGGPGTVRTAPPPPGTPVFGLANPADERGVRTVTARAGAIGGRLGGGWAHTVHTMDPGVAGESGSPLLDDRGRAVGILSSLTVGDHPSIEYTDLGRALGYAARTDGPPGLIPAPGPAFTPAPSGVDPRSLAVPAGPGLGP